MMMQKETKRQRDRETKWNASASRASSLRLSVSSSLSHRGFSFAEVMFAVIILGVGFIMIAAVFPVAIRQSKSTSDETAAAALAQGATNLIDHVAYYHTDLANAANNKQFMPATLSGQVETFSPMDTTNPEAQKAWQ